jgi:hypothetical protein
MGSDIHLNTDQESNTQNILPGNSYNSLKESNSIYDNTQHRLNVILDQKIDSSLSFRITPYAIWQVNQ